MTMIKKTTVLLFILTSLLALNACGGIGSIFMSDHKRSDDRMEQIVEALKEKDKEALKSLFSVKAIDEATDFDDGVDYLFELFKGNIESWERDAFSAGESMGGGKSSKLLRCWYTVTTDTGEYKLFLLDYAVDTIEPDNQGVYTLRAIKAENEETQFTYWQDMKIAGIWIAPEE